MFDSIMDFLENHQVIILATIYGIALGVIIMDIAYMKSL